MAGLMAGQHALIMGVANRWSIAWGVARSFAREGARCELTYQGERQLETVTELAAELPDSVVLPCDVTRDEDLAALTNSLAERVGRLDALVHSIAFARTEDLRGAFVDTSRAGFLLAHEISAFSLVAAARAAAPLMTEGGAIATLTFAASERVFPNYNVMATAKASLEASMRYLAHDLGPRNIRANAISAGPIKTASARAVAGLGDFVKVYAEKAPLRRTVGPDEVGDAAVFLCSALGRGVTGQVLYVDAGYHIMGF
jgi:enoyl-[acyl-carrier protein] reductase I